MKTPDVLTKLLVLIGLPLLTSACLQETQSANITNANAPSGAISIVSTMQYSASRNVTLNLTSSTATEMSFFLNQTCSYRGASTWEPFSASRAYTLPDQDGVYTIAVIYRNAQHFASTCQSIQVVLDRTPPMAPTFVTTHTRTGFLTKSAYFGFGPAVDALSPIAKYQARVLNASSTPLTAWTDIDATNAAALTHFVSGLSLADGDVSTIEMHAIDAAGNISSSVFSANFQAGPFPSLATKYFYSYPGGFGASLTVSRTASEDITVYYQSQDIDSRAGLDYEPMNASIKIPAGQYGVNIPIIVSDSLYPPDRHFQINYSEDPTFPSAPSQTFLLSGVGIDPNLIPSEQVSNVSVGNNVACVIAYFGSVYCYGNANQLGAWASYSASIPTVGGVAVLNLQGNNVSKITSDVESCALLDDGTLQCWGTNNGLAVGNGTAGTSPWDTFYTLANVVDVASSNGGTCAILGTGEVDCWGNNASGRFGNGTTSTTLANTSPTGYRSTDTPTSLPVKVVMGTNHMCLLLANGNTKCAGSNLKGQLGTGSTTPTQSTTLVATQSTSHDGSIWSGDDAVCISRTTTQAVFCWGSNSNGLIGQALATPFSAARVAFTALNGAQKIALGSQHACAIDSSNKVNCWGSNIFGQLAKSTVLLNSPYGLSDRFTNDAQDISIRDQQTCAVDTGGLAYCWGSGTFAKNTQAIGEYYRGSNDFGDVLTDQADLGRDVVHLHMGFGLSCAIKSNDHGWCWGTNPLATSDAVTPSFYSIEAQDVSNTPVYDIASGVDHVCYVTKPGRLVYCKGKNNVGQLGNGTTVDSDTFVQVTGLAADTASLAIGRQFSCALSTAGAVKCWGASDVAQTGAVLSSPAYATAAVLVAGIPAMKAIDAGLSYACGLSTVGGTVYCWGSNSSGQMGIGLVTASQVAGTATLVVTGATMLKLGPTTACALNGDANPRCWGSNIGGQFGFGSTSAIQSAPSFTGFGAGEVSFGIGALTTCMAEYGAYVLCAGSNAHGELGVGVGGDNYSAGQVFALEQGATEIGTTTMVDGSSLQSYTCVLTKAVAATVGSVHCFGADGYSHGTRGRGRSIPLTLQFDN